MATPLTRFNAKVARPSSSIDFVEVRYDEEPEEALARLHLLAAFFSPIQTTHSLHVRRLSDYTYGSGYLGRNYGAGEHIVLALRDGGGRWHSFESLVLTYTHELAHCRFSSHGHDFHRLAAQLLDEARELLAQGWAGGGMHSVGRTPDGTVAEDGLLKWRRSGVAVPEALSIPSSTAACTAPPRPLLTSTSSSSPSFSSTSVPSRSSALDKTSTTPTTRMRTSSAGTKGEWVGKGRGRGKKLAPKRERSRLAVETGAFDLAARRKAAAAAAEARQPLETITAVSYTQQEVLCIE